MKILLAGEGANELGGWSGHENYRGKEPGVIEALLRKVCPNDWKITHAVPWKNIKKLKVGAFKTAEQQNIKGLHLLAEENGLDAVAFVRDRDADKNREKDIEGAIALIEENNEGGPGIIGGMAVEKIEAWILALSGETKSEKIRHPQKKFGDLDIKGKNTAQFVAAVKKADLDKIPKDALSLNLWLERARRLLNPSK